METTTLDYIGSLATGVKGPPKQHIRFNPDKFDVDANLEAPPLVAYALREKGVLVDRNRIFGQSAEIEKLNNFTSLVGERLKAVEGIDTGDPFDVVLTVTDNDIKAAVELEDNPNLEDRLLAQQKAEEATKRCYELRQTLNENDYIKLVEEMTEKGFLTDSHIRGSNENEEPLSSDESKDLFEILDKYDLIRGSYEQNTQLP